LLPATLQTELELEPGTSDVVFAKRVIEKGYVTEREFLDVLKRQNYDIILSLFEWRNGDFIFFEDQLPDSQPISLKMPLSGLLERGIDRARKRRQINSKLPEDAIFKVKDPSFRKEIMGSPGLPENIRNIFRCMQEPLTLRHIVVESGLTEFETAVILSKYLEEDRIEAINPTVSEIPEIIRKSLAEAEILHARGRFWEALTRLRKAVRKLPGNPELQGLFRKYDRDFKQDLQITIVSTDRIPVVIKTVDDAFFSRFPKDSALGFILSRIDSRSSVKALSQLLQIGSDKLMVTLYLLKKAEIIKLMEPKGPLPEEIAKRRQYVRKIWERITTQNFYEVLGVDQDVSASQVKTVYFELAKQYHPDSRPDDDPEDVDSKLDEIFVKIKDAYQTLSDPDRRAGYDQSLATSELDIETQKSRSKAQLQYRVGLKAFHTRKFRTAMEYFRSAIDLDPYEPVYYHQMGELCARNPKWYRAGILACKKAIELDPEVPEYHAVLGILFRLEGDLLDAEKEFSTTLKFDPKNMTARKELKAMGKDVPLIDDDQDTRFTPVPRKKS